MIVEGRLVAGRIEELLARIRARGVVPDDVPPERAARLHASKRAALRAARELEGLAVLDRLRDALETVLAHDPDLAGWTVAALERERGPDGAARRILILLAAPAAGALGDDAGPEAPG